jgi:uncharacterized protein with GYD domain
MPLDLLQSMERHFIVHPGLPQPEVPDSCERRRRHEMVSYVVLYRWTDQGVRNLKDTVTRARDFTAVVEKAGGKIVKIYWTQGRYDLVSITEFPNEETAMALSMSLGKLGNIRTETLRAFTAEEMESILKRVQ